MKILKIFHDYIVKRIRARFGLMDIKYTEHLEDKLFEKEKELEKWILRCKDLDETVKVLHKKLRTEVRYKVIGDADWLSPTIDKGLRWKGEPEVVE